MVLKSPEGCVTGFTRNSIEFSRMFTTGTMRATTSRLIQNYNSINSQSLYSRSSIFSSIHLRNLFVRTEQTPNPASLKFLPGEPVLPKEYGSGMSFKKNQNYSNSPLASRLFRIDGVDSVMFGEDFISIVKSEEISWRWGVSKNKLS